MERGESIGIDWAGTMAKRRQHDWEAELAAVVDSSVQYPEYYTQPFHAYEQVGLTAARAATKRRNAEGACSRMLSGHAPAAAGHGPIKASRQLHTGGP